MPAMLPQRQCCALLGLPGFDVRMREAASGIFLAFGKRRASGNQAMGQRVVHQFGVAGKAHLFHQVVLVGADGLAADGGFLGNDIVAEPKIAEAGSDSAKATIMIFGMLSCVLFRSIPLNTAAAQDKIPDKI